MSVGVHVAADWEGSNGCGTPLGGFAQGTLLKSKKSSKSGCAASRAVKETPFKKRVSTNLMMAV